ncbi:MAG TPA: hypothetical protein VLA93_06040 [Pyrinomonadaceae bacterium]|nr:hypothetical protein [Pyrinomonadaceae bacterium]
MKSLVLILLVLIAPSAIIGQHPRSVETEKTTKPAPAPSTVKAKYEGGVFGYTKTMEGMLTLDDTNRRVYFKHKGSEKELHIPYDAIVSAFADTKKVQPAAATVASSVPTIFTLPARFIKTKVRYLTLQYSDPDTKMNGTTSFKLENQAILNSVLVALAEKTGMVQRGDIYVKKKESDQTK